MSATATNWLELIEQLPDDAELKLHNISWDDYEELLEQVGEASGVRISYADRRRADGLPAAAARRGRVSGHPRL